MSLPRFYCVYGTYHLNDTIIVWVYQVSLPQVVVILLNKSKTYKNYYLHIGSWCHLETLLHGHLFRSLSVLEAKILQAPSAKCGLLKALGSGCPPLPALAVIQILAYWTWEYESSLWCKNRCIMYIFHKLTSSVSCQRSHVTKSEWGRFMIYIIYLEPTWPLFLGGLTFHFMGQTFQNMGHLGSRYIHTNIYQYI